MCEGTGSTSIEFEFGFAAGGSTAGKTDRGDERRVEELADGDWRVGGGVPLDIRRESTSRDELFSVSPPTETASDFGVASRNDRRLSGILSGVRR